MFLEVRRHGELLLLTAVLTAQVFNDPHRPPDVEFGCFTALYGPRGNAFEDQALLRVDVGAGRTGRGKAMPMFVPMARSDVARSAITTWHHLYADKLMGRDLLAAAALSVDPSMAKPLGQIFLCRYQPDVVG